MTGSQIRRKVLGSFQLTVPFGTADALLEPEERLLAFFRWILSTLDSGDRWRPVIERYVCEIILRVKGFGGDPSKIPPSPVGAIPSKSPPGVGPGSVAGKVESTGKIEGLLYDRFGDFEEFILRPSPRKAHLPHQATSLRGNRRLGLADADPGDDLRPQSRSARARADSVAHPARRRAEPPVTDRT